MKKDLKNTNKGITLIALVITIIVLLILAGVVIITLTGEDGILTKAQGAKIETDKGAAKEKLTLYLGEYRLEKEDPSNQETIKPAVEWMQDKGYIKAKDDYYIFSDGKKAKTDGDVCVIEEGTVEEGTTEKNYLLNYYKEANGTAETLLRFSESGIILANVLQKEAGLYDSDETLLASWDTLVSKYNLNIEKNYNSSTYHKENSDGNSMYYVLNQDDFKDETGLTLIIPESSLQTGYVKDEFNIVSSYKIASINEGLKVATTNNKITNIGEYAFRNCDSLTSVTIPSSVTSIGSKAFSSCSSLTSVTIPSSVTSIGEFAFYYCDSLTSVTISEGVTSIGREAFSSCSSLTSVTIPSSVTSIGECAFRNCYSLTSVTISEGVTSIGSEAFASCRSLTSVTIPSSVTSMGSYAFASCRSLTNVTISEGVTKIGYAAFSSCSSLTSVTIPSSVTTIGYAAFASCSSLTSIEVNSNNTCYTSIDGVVFSKDKTEIVMWPNGKEGEYEIPDSVTSIGDYAFYYCDSLTSVTIPSSVTSIGSKAFASCSSLTSVTIPSSVTSIGENAFQNCDSLTSVTIPSSVTSIGEYAFYDCDSLTSVTISEGVTSIGEYAFYYCSSLTSVTIPSSVKSIEYYAFCQCESLTSVTISEGVTSIGEYAFYYCSSLTSVTIPEGVTSIGDYAFDDCDSLTSVTIPEGVTSIECSTFYSCDSLTSVTIPYSVTSIRSQAFAYCYNLSITIPYTVQNIESEDAFESCQYVYYENGREYYFGESGSESESGGGYDEFYIDYDSDKIYISTSHNYADNMSASYSDSFTNAKKIIFEFSSESCLEDSYDYVEIYDSNSNLIYSSRGNGSDALSSLRVEVQGNSFTIKMYSDGSTNYYGFECVVSPEY